MKKWIGSFALWVMGWKIVLQGDSKNLNRCVLVVAPHTTNWEFVLGILAYWKLEKPIKLIIKDAHTKAWYGWLVRKLGGIGIDRSQRRDALESEQVAYGVLSYGTFGRGASCIGGWRF